MEDELRQSQPPRAERGVGIEGGGKRDRARDREMEGETGMNRE